MKQLYTSNYARAGLLPEAVVISCTFPKWIPESEFKGEKRIDLAPEWWMVQHVNIGDITSEEYNQLYMDLLIHERGLTAQAIFDSLEDGSILICYEKPGETCHRRTLATWIEKEIGVVIPEWRTEKEREEDRLTQKKEQLVDSVLKF